MASNRAKQWRVFAGIVENHIETYTVPQYGDAPDDQAEGFDLNDIQKNIQRYANRIGKNLRGDVEARRDCLKIAHYACLLEARLKKEVDDGA